MKSTRNTSGKVRRTTRGILHVTAEFECRGKKPTVATTSLVAVLPSGTTSETLRQAVDVAIALCTATYKPTLFTYNGNGASVFLTYLKKNHVKSSKVIPTKKRLRITS